MKVYTKGGDKGKTALIGGTRVPKHHIRIEAYGTVDELNSYLGLIRDQEAAAPYRALLLVIQERLFTLGSHLATDPGKSRMVLPEFYAEDAETLEAAIDEMDKDLPPMRNFVLPGGHVAVSHCHVARCICRRAERCAVHLNEVEEVDPLILSYLNRLSDYLFVLGRKLTLDTGAEEVPWVPNPRS